MQPGIEPRSPRPLANTLPTSQLWSNQTKDVVVTLKKDNFFYGLVKYWKAEWKMGDIVNFFYTTVDSNFYFLE